MSQAWETQHDIEVAYNTGSFGPITATALTNTTSPGLTAKHTTSGTPAAGIGVCVDFDQQTLAAGNTEVGGKICAVTTDVTSTSEDFDIVIYAQSAGAAASEVARFTSTGVLKLVNAETIDNTVNGTITYTATTHDFAGAIQTDGTLDVQGGDITLENDEVIGNGTDGTVNTDGIFQAPALSVQDATEASGLMKLQTFTASSGALTGATDTIEVNIPSGALIYATQLRVDVAVVNDGDNTWAAAFSGGSTQAIAAAGTAAAKNTKVNIFFDANAATAIAASETDITLTPQAANFTAGEITAVVYYWTLTSLDDAP